MDLPSETLRVAIDGDASAFNALVEGVNRDLAGLGAAGAAAAGDFSSLGVAATSAGEVMADATVRAGDRMASVFSRFAASGRLSFEDLKRSALGALDDIASAAISSGIEAIFKGGDSGGGGGFLASLGTAFATFAGRASGGPVSESRPFIVGERGPELFVPQSAGRVLANQGLGVAARGRPLAINITVNAGAQGDAAQIRQSAGQIAVAVRRAVARAERDL